MKSASCKHGTELVSQADVKSQVGHGFEQPSGWCPCPWQSNEIIFKVPSNPNHSMIL